MPVAGHYQWLPVVAVSSTQWGLEHPGKAAEQAPCRRRARRQCVSVQLRPGLHARRSRPGLHERRSRPHPTPARFFDAVSGGGSACARDGWRRKCVPPATVACVDWDRRGRHRLTAMSGREAATLVATQAQQQVQRRLLLDVVVRQSAVVLQLPAGEDDPLLMWANALRILDHVLEIFNRRLRQDLVRE